MAVVNVKSATITNRDATPKVPSNSVLVGAGLLAAVGKAEAGATDEAGSTYRFFQIPSNARMHSLKLWADILDGGGGTMAFDVGLYDTTENGAAVVDVDFFASAVAGSTGVLNAVDITHEAAANNGDIAKGEMMIWQALGLTSDPKKMYDVVATTTGANDAAGTMLLKGTYAA